MENQDLENFISRVQDRVIEIEPRVKQLDTDLKSVQNSLEALVRSVAVAGVNIAKLDNKVNGLIADGLEKPAKKSFWDWFRNR